LQSNFSYSEFVLFSTKQKVQQRRAEAEQALDQKLFDETHQATMSDELERRQRKLELRDESQRYRNYLEQRKIDEQRQQVELDRILQTELDRQNAIRTQKVRAEKEKRAKLLHEVVEGRKQQIIDRSMTILSKSCCISLHFAFRRKKSSRGYGISMAER